MAYLLNITNVWHNKILPEHKGSWQVFGIAIMGLAGLWEGRPGLLGFSHQGSQIFKGAHPGQAGSGLSLYISQPSKITISTSFFIPRLPLPTGHWEGWGNHGADTDLRLSVAPTFPCGLYSHSACDTQLMSQKTFPMIWIVVVCVCVYFFFSTIFYGVFKEPRGHAWNNQCNPAKMSSCRLEWL